MRPVTIVCEAAPSLPRISAPNSPLAPPDCAPSAPSARQPPDDGHKRASVADRHPLSLFTPTRVRPPLAPFYNRSFFTGDITLVPDICIYHSTIFLKLVRFSYAYVLSLCVCDYFSRKLLAKFEFPYLKARYVLFFHRKEFRRKSNPATIGFLNHFTAQIGSTTVIFKSKLLDIVTLYVCKVSFPLNILFNLNNRQS